LEIEFDTRIVKDSIGRFYIIILKLLEPVRQKAEDTYKKIITLDPGVSTFLTGFDADVNTFKFGKHSINILHNKLLRPDDIQSETNQKKEASFVKFKHIIQAKAKRYACLIVPCAEHYFVLPKPAQNVAILTIS
jgi:transposase